MAIFLITKDSSCLADMWKHFKYWLSSSNPSLNYWTYFPKDYWWILKQGKITFCTARVSAFHKFRWLLRYLFLKIVMFPLIFKSHICNHSSCTAFCDYYVLVYLSYATLILFFNLEIPIFSNSCFKFVKSRIATSNAMNSDCTLKGLETFSSCFATNTRKYWRHNEIIQRALNLMLY